MALARLSVSWGIATKIPADQKHIFCMGYNDKGGICKMVDGI